jgi:hypothetical protein
MTKPILVAIPWLALIVGEAVCRIVTGSWPAWPVLLVLTGSAAAMSLAIGLHDVLNAVRAASEQRSFEAGRLYEAATRSSRPLVELQRPAGPQETVIAHWPPRGMSARRRPHLSGERGSSPDRRPRPPEPKF